jgi:cell division protein FtsW
MSRFKGKAPEGIAVAAERQLNLVDWLDGFARRAEEPDPSRPALGIFLVVLSLLGLGLILQVNHAATTAPLDEFWKIFGDQLFFRIGALLALLVGFRIGPEGLRRTIPALMVFCCLALIAVYVPGLADPRNGANRWVSVLGLFSFQPSELARIVGVLWVADRCMRLGDDVRDLRKGVLPMLAVGFAFFFLILGETDLGGAMLFLLCFLGTMWVGGAQFVHVAGPLVGIGGTAALLVITFVTYIRNRVAMFLGHTSNHQVDHSADALASGDLFGVGLGQGQFRNARVPYLETDYVLALVGEELGLIGVWAVIGLLLCFAWFSLRFVLSIKDRYCALAAFGLLLSFALQSMVHVQVVTRLAPPKGMPLPFLSHGGTALLVSSFAIGLALGAARPSGRPAPEHSSPEDAPRARAGFPVPEPASPRCAQDIPVP